MTPSVRAELKGLIQQDKLNLVSRSFDIIGSKQKAVAIIELPEGLGDFEVMIAKAMMRVHRNIASVLAKESERAGEYRTRELRIVAGDLNTEVMHKESGCLFRLDPRLVYFSPRECAERERITAAVREGERVLVMFSGIGPLPICIAKKHRNVLVTAVELNPHAHSYCVENIHLNRVGDRVRAIEGDVRKVCRNLGETYDRVIMPLPKGAYQFLDVAVPLIADGGILHFYHWATQDDLYTKAEDLVTRAAEDFGRRIEFINRVKVSQYNPRTWKIRLDARILTR
jgi:tRNA (guanine37-N1)-methyltransferase